MGLAVAILEVFTLLKMAAIERTLWSSGCGWVLSAEGDFHRIDGAHFNHWTQAFRLLTFLEGEEVYSYSLRIILSRSILDEEPRAVGHTLLRADSSCR